jgi:hypothetical protein
VLHACASSVHGLAVAAGGRTVKWLHSSTVVGDGGSGNRTHFVLFGMQSRAQSLHLMGCGGLPVLSLKPIGHNLPLFGMQTRAFGPWLMTSNIPIMHPDCGHAE